MKPEKEKIIDNLVKETFAKLLSDVSDLTIEQVAPVVEIMEVVNVKRNTIIIDRREISGNFYFIYSGVVRVYFYKNERMIIERFESERGFFGGNFTRVNNGRSTHVYESLEDTILLKINYTDLDELCKRSHEIERAYRIILETFHYSYTNRIYAFKALTTEERYSEFMHSYGDIANRIPLKDVANYLDMTPETLSRIRSKYDKLNNK